MSSESPAARHQLDRLIAKLFTYSSGLAGSKVLPMTTNVLLVAAGSKLLRCREGAARMAIPDILRENMDESDAVIDGALVHRVGREETINVVGTQVRDHFGRWNGADLDVLVGIEPVLREVIAQQVIVHRIVERHCELEALPGLRVALVLMLDGERNRLPVDVFNRRHRVGNRIRARAERDCE